MQDFIFLIGGFFLAAALIPLIQTGQAPPLSTSVPTTLVLAAYAVCFFTLDLPMAGVAVTIQATLWLALVLQRLVTLAASEHIEQLEAEEDRLRLWQSAGPPFSALRDATPEELPRVLSRTGTTPD